MPDALHGCECIFIGKSAATPGKAGPGTCRFCGTTSNTGVLAIGNVCSDPDCQVINYTYMYIKWFHYIGLKALSLFFDEARGIS